jgi:putative transposase
MTRLARSTLVGYPHQVTQEGNYGQTVFEEEADFLRYRALMRECAPRYGIEVWAYCLMPNHVHFVCVPKADGALARGFNTVHMRYAQYFHAKKGLTGPLWRGRFLSCMLDERSVFEEVRFIENNPVRAQLVGAPEEYPWSSAGHHCDGGGDPLVEGACFFGGRIGDWRSYLAGNGDLAVLERTWKCLKTGRPAGDRDWVRNLEGILGRRLEAMPRGRPRKVQTSHS